MQYPEPLERLIEELQRLPTIGPKSAQRLAFHILGASPDYAISLAKAVVDVKRRIFYCRRCGNIADSDLCAVCRNPRRDASLLCVVATPRDLVAVERTGVFNGLYHVLGGLISPLDGVCPEDLQMDKLMERLEAGGIREVICATNPTVAGEATALYIQKLLEGRSVRLTRLALGLPVGADMEYADEVTLGQALTARKDF